jgi:hypothetical protein
MPQNNNKKQMPFMEWPTQICDEYVPPLNGNWEEMTVYEIIAAREHINISDVDNFMENKFVYSV